MPTRLVEILPYGYRIVKPIPYSVPIGGTFELKFGSKPLLIKFLKPKEGRPTIGHHSQKYQMLVRVARGPICTWAGPIPFKMTEDGFYEFVLHAEPRSNETVHGTVHIVHRALNEVEEQCFDPVIFEAYANRSSLEFASDEIFALETYYDTVSPEDDPVLYA